MPENPEEGSVNCTGFLQSLILPFFTLPTATMQFNVPFVLSGTMELSTQAQARTPLKASFGCVSLKPLPARVKGSPGVGNATVFVKPQLIRTFVDSFSQRSETYVIELGNMVCTPTGMIFPKVPAHCMTIAPAFVT